MLKKVRNVKLNVRPITINMAHKYYYEGPCRFQAGENLQPGFDQMVNGQMLQLVEMEYRFCMPEFVNMLDVSLKAARPATSPSFIFEASMQTVSVQRGPQVRHVSVLRASKMLFAFFEVFS